MRPFVVHTDDQRSEGWRLARVGRVTGSCAADMQAKVKSGEAAGRRNLRIRLVLERLTGQPYEDGYQSKDMQRGIEVEGDAFKAYEAQTGTVARRAGFLGHPTLLAGCSVDGEIGGFRGIVELKCPKSATHLSYLRSREIPDEYLKQCQHNLWLTGAQFCDFVSFDPRFPAPLRLMISRVTLTDAERAAYEVLLRAFLSEVERELAEVQQMAEMVF